jgi:hypothetical protein
MRALWILLAALAAHHHGPSTCTSNDAAVITITAVNPGSRTVVTCADHNGHFVYLAAGSTVQEGHNGVPSPVTGKGGIPAQGWYKVS